MKHLLFLALMWTSIACGDINVEADKPKDTNVDLTEGERDSDSPDLADKTKTTTTTTTVTTTETTSSEAEENYVVATYSLEHRNPAVTEFVGGNYCVGSQVHDCWIRSGLAKEYVDGTWEVSIEFWDTAKQIPYTVDTKIVESEQAFLLTDSAKSIDDEGYGFRMLWAIVDVEDKNLGVYYDWAGDGPMEQGDDLLDAFNWVQDEGE